MDDLDFDYDSEHDLYVGDLDEMDQEKATKLQRTNEVAQVPLFEGSPLSSLEAVILFLN